MFTKNTVKVKQKFKETVSFTDLTSDEAESLVSALEDLDFIEEIAIIKKKEEYSW